jgi:hypothetical protein
MEDKTTSRVATPISNGVIGLILLGCLVMVIVGLGMLKTAFPAVEDAGLPPSPFKLWAGIGLIVAGGLVGVGTAGWGVYRTIRRRSSVDDGGL